jgi:hypothetical protein
VFYVVLSENMEKVALREKYLPEIKKPGLG